MTEKHAGMLEKHGRGLIALLTFVKILVKYIQLIKPVNCSSMSNGGRRWDVMEK